MMLDPVIFAWEASSFFGWGVVGLNMMLYWRGAALSAMPGNTAVLGEGDPRWPWLQARLEQSRSFRDGFGNSLVPAYRADSPVFVALGNDLTRPLIANRISLTGNPTIAFPVFEDVSEVEKNIERLKEYPLVITASSWNRDVLTSFGVESKLCHQGYDPALFNPLIRNRSRKDGRFRVFSGGKAEYRKGHDLVLRAFKLFADKHDDAVLVAAWSSPWPSVSLSFDGKTDIGSPPGAENGLPNYAAWAQKYGIKRHQFELVPATPNCAMPEVLSNVDAAAFLSRAEGGTNLVAMECMAAGIPTIISDRAGHADLPVGACIGLFALDEIVKNTAWALECAYAGTHLNQTPLGGDWAWPARIEELTGILRDSGL